LLACSVPGLSFVACLSIIGENGAQADNGVGTDFHAIFNLSPEL
jgi:hypothetical protein